MGQTDLRERLVADVQSGSDEAALPAAIELFALGEYGSPAGAYLLYGGKAALRLGRWADAAYLLFQGLQVVQPQTLLWASLLVSRAVACARFGLHLDAVQSGTEFLNHAHAFPEAAAWVPNAHHALGMAYDRLREYGKAVLHHRAAFESYQTGSVGRTWAAIDLAYSLAMSGSPDEADQVLAAVTASDHERSQFAILYTRAVVRYHQGRFAEALSEAEQAESIAADKGDAWAIPLAEVRYWLARAAWALGDGYRAGLAGLRAAVMADQHRQVNLCDDATNLLAEIREKGGI